MSKTKAKFKKGDKFFHPTQDLFVIIDEMDFFQGKGWLYTLKCFKHEKDVAVPWKRYYESKVLTELIPLRPNQAARVLYANS
jgi:hypothetical protein